MDIHADSEGEEELTITFPEGTDDSGRYTGMKTEHYSFRVAAPAQ